MGLIIRRKDPRTPICYAVDRKKSGRRGTVAEERPDLIQQWDTEQNGAQTPYNVTAGSPYKAAWKCGKRCEHCENAHEGWRAAIVDRCKLQSTGCPFCRCACRTLCVSTLPWLHWAIVRAYSKHHYLYIPSGCPTLMTALISLYGTHPPSTCLQPYAGVLQISRCVCLHGLFCYHIRYHKAQSPSVCMQWSQKCACSSPWLPSAVT